MKGSPVTFRKELSDVEIADKIRDLMRVSASEEELRDFLLKEPGITNADVTSCSAPGHRPMFMVMVHGHDDIILV